MRRCGNNRQSGCARSPISTCTREGHAGDPSRAPQCAGALFDCGQARTPRGNRVCCEFMGKCAEFWPSPGFVDERLALFVAKGLQPGPTDMDTDEFIHPILMPIVEAIEQCHVGHINDGKTLVGLLWYAVFEGLTGH